MSAPLPKKKISFWKGLVLTYLVFLAIFFAATPFLTMLLYWEADLSTSILPELIGFCLQGTFLVVVFALYERRTENQSRKNHKFALRTLLESMFIRALLTDESAQDVPLNPEEMERMMDELRHGQGITPVIIKRAQEAASQELAPFSSLTTVAAQIDAPHLELWSRMVIIMRSLRDAKSDEQIRDDLQRLTQLIDHFDELPVS